jgi:L-lactate utilization protein LutC
MIRDVKDLSPGQKLAVESLLGRPVSEQETVSVQAFQPPAISDQRRQEIVGALRQYFSEVDAKRQPVSAQEADDIINEAMRNSRPGYRPHQ